MLKAYEPHQRRWNPSWRLLNLRMCNSWGLLNYYRTFLPNLATVVKPLNNLLHKGQKWRWSTECSQAMCRQGKTTPDNLQVSGTLRHHIVPVVGCRRFTVWTWSCQNYNMCYQMARKTGSNHFTFPIQEWTGLLTDQQGSIGPYEWDSEISHPPVWLKIHFDNWS